MTQYTFGIIAGKFSLQRKNTRITKFHRVTYTRSRVEISSLNVKVANN